MKVRIKPLNCTHSFRFAVQRKRIIGWETLYKANLIGYCIQYVDDLRKLSDVKFIKM
jgi:hypothetical protein